MSVTLNFDINEYLDLEVEATWGGEVATDLTVKSGLTSDAKRRSLLSGVDKGSPEVQKLFGNLLSLVKESSHVAGFIQNALHEAEDSPYSDMREHGTLSSQVVGGSLL